MADPIPLYYTFGNHQHWVDMEWLWGYHVLPNSIRDMLKLCHEAGVKGCVNFDGIGYEKLASEDPEAFADLKQAVQEGTFEIVGGSYGQPYGLFHGGESNVRQRIFGARASKRLFGVPVQTFWEEEFDFFPQLPQILRGVGIKYASLFFQWTWHTPEVPREDVPVVWWEGQDGSRLLCATRNKLNLHQWPEDMDIVLAELADSPPSSGGPTPLVLQWLELMPSPDWMCRSELILPKLRQLMSDPRFDVRPVTLGEYLCSIGFQPMGRSAFQADHPFDPESPIEIRKGAKLPHWTRENAIYHVTFRLFDSVPLEVQEQWREERMRLNRLDSEGKLTDRERFEYQRLLEENIDAFLDEGHGSCLLRDSASAEIVANALRHFDGQRYRLYAWCVMPNHVHALVQPIQSHGLPGILHSWKSYTSNRLNEHLNRKGEIWQREYYDHMIRNEAEWSRTRDYILENPAKAKLPSWPWVEATRGLDEGQDAPNTHRLEADATPVRRYTMDQVWHGMTLGKNGDNIRRLSRQAEASLLSAETLAAVAGLFGRPYAQWDVYPTWELEEAWRELLSAQHHDIDECEGLCGYVGRFSYERSMRLSGHILERTARQLLRRIEREHEAVLFNPLGWEREGIPPFGYGPDRRKRDRFRVDQSQARIDRDGFSAAFDGVTGILEVGSARLDLTAVKAAVSGEHLSFAGAARSLSEGDNGELWFELRAASGHALRWTIDVAADVDAIDLELAQFPAIRPDPGLNSSLKWHILFPGEFEIRADSPYGVHPVSGLNKNLKKYPTGDWMTSKQWFETVENTFASSSLVDLHGADDRLLILHDGSQQWFRNADGVSCVLSAKDPWDEDYYAPNEIVAAFRVCPHAGLPASKCWKMGQELSRPLVRLSEADSSQAFMLGAVPPPRTLSATCSSIGCSAENVALTAFYRETRDSAKGQDFPAADVLGVDYLYVLRMVELDGIETEVTLTLGATVARALKTNLLGEPEIDLDVTEGSKVPIQLRPFEIATVYLDLVEGRKQVRDLDAKREIWATVHRVD